jgi:hypothetical protein
MCRVPALRNAGRGIAVGCAFCYTVYARVAQWIEHLASNQKVASSSLVASTLIRLPFCCLFTSIALSRIMKTQLRAWNWRFPTAIKQMQKCREDKSHAQRSFGVPPRSPPHCHQLSPPVHPAHSYYFDERLWLPAMMPTGPGEEIPMTIADLEERLGDGGFPWRNTYSIPIDAVGRIVVNWEQEEVAKTAAVGASCTFRCEL